MKFLAYSLPLVALLAAGCASEQKNVSKPAAQAGGFTIQTARFLNGRITAVDVEAGIVVVNFPIGRLPVLEQKLAVYRHGVSVGEIKITGPQRDDNIVAEIQSGEILPDDEARDR